MAQDGLARRVAPLFGLCGVAPLAQTHEGYAPSSRLAQPKNRRNATHPNISTGCQVGFGEALFHVAGLEFFYHLVDVAFHEAVEVVEG